MNSRRLGVFFEAFPRRNTEAHAYMVVMITHRKTMLDGDRLAHGSAHLAASSTRDADAGGREMNAVEHRVLKLNMGCSA